MKKLATGASLATLATLSLGPGCADDPAPAPPSDVAAVIQQHCGACHTAGGIAPYPFDTHAQAASAAVAIKQAVNSGTMPPSNVNNDGSCQTFVDAPTLDDVAKTTIVDWVDAGAPAVPWTTPRAPERVDIGANATISTPPYSVGGAAGQGDDYRCFVLDLDHSGTKYLTGFDVHPGETSVVHHVVVFQPDDLTATAAALALDDAEPGEGYTCFGSAGVPAGVVLGWAPGGTATQFPARTGVPIIGENKLIVQMHYYPGMEEVEDTTAIDLALADAVEHPARIGGSGDFDMVLAPGQETASTTASWNMFGLPTNTVHGVFPHMHKRGRAMRLDVVGEQGRSCLVDVPRWDFDWQRFSFYETPLLIDKADTVELGCAYDTSADVSMVPYGDGSDDEMCLSFLYITLGAYEGAQYPQELAAPTPPTSPEPVGAAPDTMWTKRHGGTGWDGPRDLAVHPNGDTSGVGFVDQAGDPDVSGDPDEGSTYDALVMRWSPDGTERYRRTFGGSGEDWLMGMAHDGATGSYIGGVSDSPDWTLDGLTLTHLGDRDAFVAALDEDGSARWAHRFGSAGRDALIDLAAHPDGGFVTVSRHFDGVTVGSESADAAPTGITAAIVRWLDDGSVAWMHTFPVGVDGEIISVAVGPDGSVYAAGVITDGSMLGDDAFEVAGARDGYLIEVAANGERERFVPLVDAGDGFATAVAVDDSGTVYVGTEFQGSASYLGSEQPFRSGLDAAVIAVDATTTRTLAVFTGPGNTGIGALTVNGDGDVILVGSFEGGLEHAGSSIASRGASDIFMAELAASATDGATRWLETFGGHGFETSPVVAHGNGRVVLAFESTAAIDGMASPRGNQDVIVVAKSE